MAKTLLQLVTQFRVLTDDYGDHAISGDWVTDDEDCTWSNDTVTEFLNEAQETYCGISPIIDSTSAAAQVTVLGGASTALLHSSVRAVLFCKRATDGVKLARTDARFIDEQEAKDDEPEFWALGYQSGDQRTLYVYPTPEADTDLELRVERGPLVPLDWASNGATPEIPAIDHRRLVHYAAYLAFQSNDSDAGNLEKARRHLELWGFEVGPNDNETLRRDILREIRGAVIRTTPTAR